MSRKSKNDATNEENIVCDTTCPPIRNVTHPLRYYEFTQEEMKALEECDKESFYQRCLPFSTGFATATFAAIKYGHLKKHPHWGAVPKVAAAASLGYVLGRASYLSQCDAKLRELSPGSHLGTVMRKYHDEATGKGPQKKA